MNNILILTIGICIVMFIISYYKYREASEESVYTPEKKKNYSVLDVVNGKVTNIWSSSPEDYHPYVIDFDFNSEKYHLKGAKRLKKVCKLFGQGQNPIFFTARLHIEENKKIVKVEKIPELDEAYTKLTTG